MSEAVELERNHRLQIWQELKTKFDAQNIRANVLHELRVYGGQQGIWMDKLRTREVSSVGVTVGLKHSGRHYVDDLYDDGVIYHYPVTDRPGHDESEIEATKETMRLGLPLFVITEQSGGLRRVYLGWVIDWDDAAKHFLISFEDQPVYKITDELDQEEFNAFDYSNRPSRSIKSRPKQAEFKFDVIKRYGAKCAFCDLELAGVLDAIHLIPKSENGSDDARNGLVLCPTHHRIFDSGLVGIDPNSLKLSFKTGHSAEMLHIKHLSLRHLPKRPHITALEWIWNKNKWEKG